MPDVFVGRQPIFDRQLNVYAYELLYRSGQQRNPALAGVSGEQASYRTIINTFIEIGLDRLVRDKYAAINLTESFFLEENKLPFTPKQVILEILEDIPVTAKLVDSVERLTSEGYIIALDDYIYQPDHAPLLKLAKIIKIDITLLSASQLIEHVRVLRRYAAKLVAEKVETAQEFITCRDLGFDYFQGYFLSRPQIISAESLPTNRLAVLNLLAVLHNPDADTDDLAEAINTDVTTSYKMLKLINSAAFGFSRKINSIQQGVMLLGRRNLASWASMLAMSTINDRPSEILRTAMIRAKMCELLADAAQIKPSDSYFTVGLFSALDLLLQRQLTQLLAPLPLNSDIVAALLYRKGPIGEALSCVLAYELADWPNVQFAQLSTNQILVANIEAVTWANGILDML
jgi:EAL and modified HD-GYP domain-containing signal transduction protein